MFFELSIFLIDNEKGEKRNNGRNRTTKSGKYQNSLKTRKF